MFSLSDRFAENIRVSAENNVKMLKAMHDRKNDLAMRPIRVP